MRTLDGMEVLITAAVGDRYLDEIVEGYSTARIFNSTVSLPNQIMSVMGGV